MAGLLANNGKPLGKLRGVFFTNGENRNDYPCDDDSARNAEKDSLMQEKLITGGVAGRLDHTNHNPDSNPNDETLVKEAAVMMKYFPKRNNKGQYVGECLILDNEDGQRLYAYCKSGKQPGVSYRGGIDQDAYEMGDIEGAWKQFTVEGFDIVAVPAYRECYLELVEDYLDPDSNTEPMVGKKRASIDANGAAKAMIRVAASKQGAKEMAKVMAQEKHFTESEMLEINKAIDAHNPDGKRRTKEQAKEMGTPNETAPKHTWSRQEGDMTFDMHHEAGIYGKDDVDPVTGRKIETINTGNKDEKDREVLKLQTDKQKKAEASIDVQTQALVINENGDTILPPLKKDVLKRIEEISILKNKFTDGLVDEATYWNKYREIDEKYGIKKPKENYAPVFVKTDANLNKDIDKLADETAEELVKEKLKEKKVKSGVEKGTVADKEKDEDEQLEGYVDKDGKIVKKAGVLGVQSEEEVKEDKKKKGYVDKDGKVVKTASVLGVNADEDFVSEAERITDDGIVSLGEEIVKDESEQDENMQTMETLIAEVAKLSEEIAKLTAIIEGKDKELDNRNSELNDLNASYKRLKGVVANAVSKAKASEKVVASYNDLKNKTQNLTESLRVMKKERDEIVAELTDENKEHKRVIAGYERDKELQKKALQVQASSLRQQEVENRLLSKRDDKMGRLCISLVSEMLEIDEGRFLAKRAEVKNKQDLKKVIASLQGNKRVKNTEYYQVTAGMESALPNEILELCERVSWGDEDEDSVF